MLFGLQGTPPQDIVSSREELRIVEGQGQGMDGAVVIG